MNRDLHPDLGPRQRIVSAELALRLVREVWPGAYAEGSTGPERSWWVKTDDEPLLVAHHWQIRRSPDFWLRIRSRQSALSQ
jgi:hypothetical protein